MVIMFTGQDKCYFVETSPVIIIVCAVFPSYIVISLDNMAATNIVYSVLKIVLSGKLITQ
jgi:hypothetical protein